MRRWQSLSSPSGSSNPCSAGLPIWIRIQLLYDDPARGPVLYGADAGGTRFFVACSNAYARAISRGSLHAIPVKLTP